MKLKELKLSEVALSNDELSLIKGGATVSYISPDLFDLEEERKKGKGKKTPAPQKPMPRDKGGFRGSSNDGESY